MIAETFVSERVGEFGFCTFLLSFKAHAKQKKNLSFLGLTKEQRIQSPLLFSFDCGRPSPLCRGWVQLAWDI
jgi:hypothetical protein